MGNITKDLLRRDECQPLTQAQIADIKAQTATRPKANVYIKPYEIMDLDGTEQVVGEVQKTIDGVKKKKPKYRKTISGLSISLTWNSQYCTDSSDFNPLIENVDNIIYSSGYGYSNSISTGMDCYLPIMIRKTQSNTKWSIRALESYTIHIVTIEYTKTTDEWETA